MNKWKLFSLELFLENVVLDSNDQTGKNTNFYFFIDFLFFCKNRNMCGIFDPFDVYF